MEKSRDARSSWSTVAGNGSSRRRSRATAFRDSPEEGQVELQETVRLRDRGGKRDRDRDREFSSRSKRRRGGGNREEEAATVAEEEEESGEDIVADGESDEVEDGGGISRILSSTSSNQNLRKNSLPPRVAKQQWKVADDAMIGVPIPRKARSASIKRSHDCTVSGNSGVGGAGEDIADDHSHRNQSDSPARSSAEVVSPSTSIISANKKKMKSTGPKTRSMKTTKGSSPSSKDEGDIEIEIAEVLFELKKQPQCSKKQEAHVKPSSKQETDNSGVLRDDTKSSITSTTTNSSQTAFQRSISLQKNGAMSDLFLNVAVEKNREGSSSSPAQNDSLDGAAKGESEQPAEMEIHPPKLEGTSDFNMSIGSHGHKTEESKSAKEVCTGGDENKESKKTDSPICVKGNDDPEKTPPPIKSIPEVETQKEEKFKFDLMAPLAPTSPERDGLADMALDVKPSSLRIEKGKETSNKVENEVEGFKENQKVIDEDKKVTSGKNIDFFKMNFEKPQLDGNSIIKQEHSQMKQPNGAANTVEKDESSTSVRLPIILSGWPTMEMPPVGYMPPFQTALPMDNLDKSSTTIQHPNFILSHPRPRRCLTHYDVARNIYLHQQFTKTNYFRPAGDASAALAEAKLKNMSSKAGLVLSNSLGGNHLDVSLNSVQQREQTEGDLSGSVVNDDKSSEAAKYADMTKNKQLVFQQRQGASFGNSMVPGSGFIFPIGQHQAPMATAGNQSGSTKSSNKSTSSLFNNPEAGTLLSFPAVPAVSSNMGYSHPNVVSIEAPYMAKLQNNGYSFTFSTPAGTSATYRANGAQPLPLFNGSFYPSQLYHPSQIQPAQTQSHQRPIGHHKQPQAQQQQQQQWGVQVKQSTEQQLPSSNQSRKHESEASGEDATSHSEKRAAPVQKNTYGQNLILPVQALGFTLMPSATLNNGNGGNSGDKKQSHPQNLKKTVALAPSQGLTMSFASYNGNGTPSNLNFTPVAQNTTVFQNLPDIQRSGFQVAPAPAPQATKQKNHQTSEGRNGVVLSGTNDRNTGNSSAKSSATSWQTLAFGNSERTLDFMTPSVPVSWPPPSIKSASLTPNRVAGSSSGNQQQHILQKQQQPAVVSRMAPRTKVPTNTTLPSPATTMFPCNPPPGFSQPLIQCENSIQSPAQQKNSGRTAASAVPTTSLHLASSSSVHKNSTHPKGSAPQGQTQISFGGDFKPAFTQMQHIPGHSPSSSGKLRNTSSSKTSPLVAPVQPK